MVYDKDGRSLNTIPDVAFIAYDFYDITKTDLSGQKVTATRWTVLGPDILSAAVPFVAGGCAAVRASTKAKRDLQIRRNYTNGKAAEAVEERQLKEAVFEILGRKLIVKTSQGTIKYDFVVQQGDEIINVEVKSGKARRTKAQIAKDKEVAEKGGKYVGKNAPDELKEMDPAPTRTIEWRVKDEDLN